MTTQPVKIAFELELATLPLKSLLPTKQVPDVVKSSRKFKTIAKSIAEVGLIEPLVVFHTPDQRGRYLLLDGHLRRDILLQRGLKEAECLLATDDEAYTYNKRVSRLATIQEHFLILRAIERGVSEQRIAKALDVDVAQIRRRRRLLHGIAPEAVRLLRNKIINPATFDVLRKMKPARQVEASQLMVATSTYSASYAKALLAATSSEGRVRPERRNRPAPVTSADLALMERELKDVRKQLAITEETYGRDMVDLVVVARYISQLVGSERVTRYLEENHPEMMKELLAIVSATLPREGRRERPHLSKEAIPS